MKNDSELEFKLIVAERRRTYEWADGYKLTISYPQYLNVSPSGGHRILDAEDVSHYIPNGWRHLSWTVFEGAPNFVK